MEFNTEFNDSNPSELIFPENLFNDLGGAPEQAPSEYLTGLRDGQDAKIEAFRQSMFEAYDNSDLPQIIANLKEELASGDPFDHPDYVDRGQFSMVFSVHDSSGEHLAVRLENPIITPGAIGRFNVDDYLERFAFGQGNPVLEQPKAASVEDQAIVSPFISGAKVNDLPQSHLESLNPQQITEFANGICKASNDRVWFEPNGANFLYHPDDGFKAIDYAFFDAHVENDPDGTAAKTLTWVTDDVLISCNRFDQFSGRKKDVLIDVLHEGVESSDLARKDEVHATIDEHRTGSLGKRIIGIIKGRYG